MAPNLLLTIGLMTTAVTSVASQMCLFGMLQCGYFILQDTKPSDMFNGGLLKKCCVSNIPRVKQCIKIQYEICKLEPTYKLKWDQAQEDMDNVLTKVCEEDFIKGADELLACASHNGFEKHLMKCTAKYLRRILSDYIEGPGDSPNYYVQNKRWVSCMHEAVMDMCGGNMARFVDKTLKAVGYRDAVTYHDEL